MSRSVSILSWVPVTQGVYYVASGLWPLVSMSTFLSFTGPKEDLWLVRTVALCLVVMGVALSFAGLRRRITPEIVLLGVGTAFVLAGTDLFYGIQGVIPPIYFLDAVAQVALIAGWLLGGRRRAKVNVKVDEDVKVSKQETESTKGALND